MAEIMDATSCAIRLTSSTVRLVVVAAGRGPAAVAEDPGSTMTTTSKFSVSLHYLTCVLARVCMAVNNNNNTRRRIDSEWICSSKVQKEGGT